MNRNDLETFGLERIQDYNEVWCDLLDELYDETGDCHAIVVRRDFIAFPELAEKLRDDMAKALKENPDAGNAYDALHGEDAGVFGDLNGLEFVPADEILGKDIVLMTDGMTYHH